MPIFETMPKEPKTEKEILEEALEAPEEEARRESVQKTGEAMRLEETRTGEATRARKVVEELAGIKAELEKIYVGTSTEIAAGKAAQAREREQAAAQSLFEEALKAPTAEEEEKPVEVPKGPTAEIDWGAAAEAAEEEEKEKSLF